MSIKRNSAFNIQEVVYTPSGPKRNATQMKNYINEITKILSLGYRLSLRNIQAQYRQSIFGFLWIIIPPVTTSLVWIILNKQNVVDFDSSTIPYPVFVFTGTLLWQVFTKAITLTVNSVQANKSLLSKINFPREALLVSSLIEVLVNAAISLIIIISAIIAYQIPVHFSIFLSIFGIIGLIILGFTIGLFLLPVSMLYKDIQFGLPIILQIAMYLTPVIYPTPEYSGYATFLKYNPVVPIIEATRSWFAGQPANIYLSGCIISVGISLLLLIVGLIIYRLSMVIIIERIGS